MTEEYGEEAPEPGAPEYSEWWKERRREALEAWSWQAKTEHLYNWCGLIFRQVATHYRSPSWKSLWKRSYRHRCPRCNSRDIANKVLASERGSSGPIL